MPRARDTPCRAARALRCPARWGTASRRLGGPAIRRHACGAHVAPRVTACRVPLIYLSHKKRTVVLARALEVRSDEQQLPVSLRLGLGSHLPIRVNVIKKKMGSGLGLASYLPGHVPHKCLHGRHHRLPCRRLNLQKHSCMSDGLSDGSRIGVGCLLCESSDCPR